MSGTRQSQLPVLVEPGLLLSVPADVTGTVGGPSPDLPDLERRDLILREQLWPRPPAPRRSCDLPNHHPPLNRMFDSLFCSPRERHLTASLQFTPVFLSDDGLVTQPKTDKFRLYKTWGVRKNPVCCGVACRDGDARGGPHTPVVAQGLGVSGSRGREGCYLRARL